MISEEAIEAAMESNYHMKEESLYQPYGESEISDDEPELSPEITAIRRQLRNQAFFITISCKFFY